MSQEFIQFAQVFLWMAGGIFTVAILGFTLWFIALVIQDALIEFLNRVNDFPNEEDENEWNESGKYPTKVK